MKKLITIILILALLLPAAAVSDAFDDIVGCWYLYFDSELYPELASIFGEFDKEVSVYFFQKDKSIVCLDAVVKDGKCTPTYLPCGKWDIRGVVKYSIVGIGEGTGYIDGDKLVLKYPGTEAYMTLKKMAPFDPYSDMFTKQQI